jgi:Sec-independent protein translocase protein TatA
MWIVAILLIIVGIVFLVLGKENLSSSFGKKTKLF